MNEYMMNFQHNIENLISKERIVSYGSIEKHFENLQFIAKITPKLASLEIALRNIIDYYFKFNDENWILGNTDEKDVIYQIKNNIISKEKYESLDHYQILSRFTLGNIMQIISEYKLQNKILNLDNIDFIKYSKSNKGFSFINGQKVRFSDIDKVYIALSLLQNIRNRSYHWESLLKVRESHGKFFPRITTKLQGTFIGIDHKQICPFLDDLLMAINKDMVKLTNLK